MKRRVVLLGGVAWLPVVRAEARVLAVGVTPGPHAEIMAVVQRVAEQRGLALRIEEREGGRGINADVASGTLDAACFQDAVGFAAEMQRRHDALVSAAPTVTQPFAIYSRRRASLRQLVDGDTIAIPREPVAVSRALILLHNHGLIALRDNAGLQATRRDVAVNRRGFKLVELPPAQLAGALGRLACAVIDSPHAAQAGLLPARDAIGMEDARTPYTDILAVRRADREQPWVAALVGAYRTEEVKRFILERFQDSVRRPW